MTVWPCRVSWRWGTGNRSSSPRMRRVMTNSTAMRESTAESASRPGSAVLEASPVLEALPKAGDADRKVNILIVDDQPANLLALEAVLDGLGQNVVKAHSGPEALKRVLADDFAAILLDVFMPGMDGFETASLIRQRDQSRHTPIIFLTAIGHD